MLARLLFCLAIATAAPARATVAPRYDFDNQTRIVVGVTLSGHIMISAGLEHLAGEYWSLRGEVLWAIADVPAFGLQGAVTRRWRWDAAHNARYPGERRARWGQLSVGHLQLFAREQDGRWKKLPLWHLSPGLRCGLDDAGTLDLELPIGWFHEKRRIQPIGLQTRWQGREPLFERTKTCTNSW